MENSACADCNERRRLLIDYQNTATYALARTFIVVTSYYERRVRADVEMLWVRLYISNICVALGTRALEIWLTDLGWWWSIVPVLWGEFWGGRMVRR